MRHSAFAMLLFSGRSLIVCASQRLTKVWLRMPIRVVLEGKAIRPPPPQSILDAPLFSLGSLRHAPSLHRLIYGCLSASINNLEDPMSGRLACPMITGVGTPSIIGRAAQGAPAASGAVGQGQEKNFYWLERVGGVVNTFRSSIVIARVVELIRACGGYTKSVSAQGNAISTSISCRKSPISAR